MPAPAARYEILPARGLKANLDAAIADIAENELCYATDEEVLYIKTGGVLVATGGSGSVSYGAAPPAQPEQGDLWYDTNDARLFVYTGTEWADASPDAANATVITSDMHRGYVVPDGWDEYQFNRGATVTVDLSGPVLQLLTFRKSMNEIFETE